MAVTRRPGPPVPHGHKPRSARRPVRDRPGTGPVSFAARVSRPPVNGSASMAEPRRKFLKLACDLHRHRNLGRFRCPVLRVSRNAPRRNPAAPLAMACVATCAPVRAAVDIPQLPAREGAKVADAPVLSGRVERELYDAARRAAGLPEDATQGQVIRYALAFLAGVPDPRSVAHVQRGGYRPPRREATV